MTRHWVSLAGAAALLLAGASSVSAGTGGNTYATPVLPAQPASAGTAADTHGALVVNAGGAYTPIPPADVKPGGNDPGGSTSVASPYPAPGCPGGFSYVQHSPLPKTYTIFPSFMRNTTGGYDGHDAWYGYDVPNAIQPGGNNTLTQTGYPATAANMAGHSIAVDIEIGPTSAWPSHAIWWSQQTQGLLGPDTTGTCDNGQISYGFGQTYLYGPAPAQRPPDAVLDSPPSGVGPTLLATVTGKWHIGSVRTLPGPGDTTPTFVHIPTCAWLESSVPPAPTTLHSVTPTVDSDGYTVFLVYNVTVTPGTVAWDWGDGARTASLDAPEAAPATLPSFDAASQTWSDSCSVSHRYATVSDGRTITATQTFNIAITVIWSDGVNVNSHAVACDRAANGPCTLTIGAGQGWQSGPHPVDQIEPVPFSPQTGG